MLGVDEEQGVEGRAVRWPLWTWLGATSGPGWGRMPGQQVAWPLELGIHPRPPPPLPTLHAWALGNHVLSLVPTCPSDFLVPHQGLLESFAKSC